MVKASPTLANDLAKLVDAEDGFAEVYDPATKRTFVVTEQPRLDNRLSPASPEALQAKLEAASREVEQGKSSTLSTKEVLLEARRRAGLL